MSSAVFDRGNAQPVRKAQMIVVLYRPSVTFAAAPVRVLRDAASGAGLVLVARTDSRQVSGYRVALPDLGHAADLISVTDATAAARWSQPGAVTDTLWLAPGVLPDAGPVRVVVTPLGANAHWDFAELPDLALDVTVSLVVGAEAPPAVPALALAVAPNPTSGAAAVTLSGAAGPARVVLVDALGRTVAVLHDGPLGEAARVAVPAGLAPGVYSVRAEAGASVASVRLVVVR